jgi:hypothetical protein
MDKNKIATMVAALSGKTLLSPEGEHFEMVVGVPKEFFREGESDQDALLRYLDYLDEQENG